MIDMIQLIKVENDCPAGVSKQTEILASSHIVEVDVTLYISYSTTHIISHTLEKYYGAVLFKGLYLRIII